jgi:hypothetical protein
MHDPDRERGHDRDDGPDGHDARPRPRWRPLVVGVGLVLVGTVVNKGLELEASGRAMVGAGAALALVALWRPAWLGWLDRRGPR